MKNGYVTYDRKADALYIYVNPEADFNRSMEISESVTLDIDADDEVMGIEILSPPQALIERLS